MAATRVLDQCIQQINSSDVEKYLADVFITDFQTAESFTSVTNLFKVFADIKNNSITNINDKKVNLNNNRYILQKIIFGIFNEDIPSGAITERNGNYLKDLYSEIEIDGETSEIKIEDVWSSLASNKSTLKTKKLRELNIRVYYGSSNKNSYRNEEDLKENIDMIITDGETTFLRECLGISPKDLLIINDRLSATTDSETKVTTVTSIFAKKEIMIASALLNYERLNSDAITKIKNYVGSEYTFNWENNSKMFRQIIDKLEKCLLH